ncbi:MAG: UvrD-helicase domain-containing protein, partial [Verrucomicrobia bacterium]|nr:UvrD-helicase domain-containing protein [Verrucomicrobiota bacterium]
MLTPAQQQAVAADGNVLVMAGAGTGKTRTLVERCVHRVMSGACSLDEILMVTFTEAAAAEMRQRIRTRLEEESARAPENERLAEQIALLDLAHISTLHSFCLRLVREHFYELEIDPQVAVLDESEARLLAEETLNVLLDDAYAGTDEFSVATQNLIQEQGRGWDKPIGELVLKLFHFTQTQPNPQGWLREQLAAFEQFEPGQWRRWFDEALIDWRAEWLPVLRAQPNENGNAHRCAVEVEKISAEMPRAEVAAVLNEILNLDRAWPKNKKGTLRGPIEKLFDEAGFLHALVVAPAPPLAGDQSAKENSPTDPLAEDWNWARGPMATLVRLVQEFGRRFALAKRELGALDFHDLEQFALRLLREEATGAQTALAWQWRQKLRFVFVDEYQDINAAQDAILTALGRDGTEANRFLVGDVKQSIYRFRLADPRIFQSYARAWSEPASGALVIPLTDNFRSHEAILCFVNSLFALLMRADAGGVNYDDAARLHFGNASERQSLRSAPDTPPRVELHARMKAGRGVEASPDEDAPADVVVE